MVFTPVTASQDGVVPRVDLPNINPNTNELKPRFLLHIQEAVNQLSLDTASQSRRIHRLQHRLKCTVEVPPQRQER